MNTAHKRLPPLVQVAEKEKYQRLITCCCNKVMSHGLNKLIEMSSFYCIPYNSENGSDNDASDGGGGHAFSDDTILSTLFFN